MELDPVRDAKELISLYQLGRKFKLKARDIFYWWRMGVVDPRDRKKRVKLATCHNGRERCTTLAAYREFCQARDLAFEGKGK